MNHDGTMSPNRLHNHRAKPLHIVTERQCPESYAGNVTPRGLSARGPQTKRKPEALEHKSSKTRKP